MKNAKLERFSHIQKQLVARFSGDPQCVDLPRVLRVPGFYHHKEEPFLIECVKFTPELRCTQDRGAGLCLPKSGERKVQSQVPGGIGVFCHDDENLTSLCRSCHAKLHNTL
jgi:hypothetical protein